MTNKPTSESDIIRPVERLRHERRSQREPITLTSIVALCTAGLGIAILGVEWQNLNLALMELLPPTSDGSGVKISGAVSLGSMIAIMAGAVLLHHASDHWSERSHRRMERAGILSLLLFMLSTMILLPASIWQANDVLDTGDGGGMASPLAYFAFAFMLAAWFPMSLLSNFVLLQKLKPALQRIGRTRQHDKWDRNIGAKLHACVALSGQLREVEQQREDISGDAEVTDHCAAELSATIGEVESELSGVILRREAAKASTPDAPFAATDNEYLNVVPVEALLAHRDYLRGFTPEAIAQLLNQKGN